MLLTPALLLTQAALAAKPSIVASKDFPAPKVERIEIRAESGTVSVKARPGSLVHVDAVKPAGSDGHCDVKLRLEGDTLFLQARKPQGSRAVCDGGFFVSAPPGASVEGYTGSGDVEVEGMGRALKIHTGSGEVRLVDIRGEAYAMTGSGKISARLPSAAFDARTGSGDIEVTLTKASGLVSARSGSGNIRISAPRHAAIRVHASTASGKITNPFPPAKTGPLVVEAFSGSGDITLVQSPR